MASRSVDFKLNSPTETSHLAQRFAPFLEPGDVILLEGEIGSGKTFFSRAILTEILLEPEDVPSPTFTLVQTYDTRLGEVWHTDLYRLEDPSEVIELGVADAFANAICFVEWPDRLGELMPKEALTLTFRSGEHEETRHLTLSWQDARWNRRIEALKNG